MAAAAAMRAARRLEQLASAGVAQRAARAGPLGPARGPLRARARTAGPPGVTALCGAGGLCAGGLALGLVRPGGGTACSSGAPDPATEAFAQTVKVVPYGVLGTQLRRDRSVVAVACAPDQLTAVLDSAGHHVVKAGGPKAAAGAARATYKWAGIGADDAYAADVVAAVRRAGTAKHHSYAGRQVIHVFGPDLRGLEAGHAAEALEQLAGAYRAALAEFAASGLPVLRLLPISGGILSGPFGGRMPGLTASALKCGFARLTAEQKVAVLGRQVELCIFLEAEIDDFQGALKEC